MKDRYLAIAPGVEWQKIDQSVLILHEEMIHLLAGSSAEIWLEVDGTTRVADISTALSHRHPGIPTISDDVADFVDSLILRGMLVQRDRPAGNGYRVPKHVAWTQEKDGSLAIADLRTGQRHSLEPIGGMIWTMLAEGSPLEAIESAIREVFPDAAPRCSDDLVQLIKSLVGADLLEKQAQRS